MCSQTTRGREIRQTAGRRNLAFELANAEWKHGIHAAARGPGPMHHRAVPHRHFLDDRQSAACGWRRERRRMR